MKLETQIGFRSVTLMRFGGIFPASGGIAAQLIEWSLLMLLICTACGILDGVEQVVGSPRSLSVSRSLPDGWVISCVEEPGWLTAPYVSV